MMPRTILTAIAVIPLWGIGCADLNESQPTAENSKNAGNGERSTSTPKGSVLMSGTTQLKEADAQPFEEHCYDRLAKFHAGYLALRKRKASKAEWDKFIQESQAMRQKFLPQLKRLVKTSQPDDRKLGQHLLWTLRDWVHFMLLDAHDEELSDTEPQFTKQLHSARRILDRRKRKSD